MFHLCSSWISTAKHHEVNKELYSKKWDVGSQILCPDWVLWLQL